MFYYCHHFVLKIISSKYMLKVHDVQQHLPNYCLWYYFEFMIYKIFQFVCCLQLIFKDMSLHHKAISLVNKLVIRCYPYNEMKHTMFIISRHQSNWNSMTQNHNSPWLITTSICAAAILNLGNYSDGSWILNIS